MSSRFKLAVVSILAFALGFAAARLIPVPARMAPEELTWERTGDTVHVSARDGGSSYLILEATSDAGTPLSEPSPSVSRATDPTVRLQAPAAVYRLWLQCPPGAQCNDCRYADDCPPPPKPPLEEVYALMQWNPALASP